jgi:protein required for attachment to host cells
VSHHSTGGERRPRKHAADQFAHRIADLLDSAHQQAQFERIIVVAGPPFLGVLRKAFPPALRALVTAEVHKDLVHQDDQTLRQHVSRVLNP